MALRETDQEGRVVVRSETVENGVIRRFTVTENAGPFGLPSVRVEIQYNVLVSSSLPESLIFIIGGCNRSCSGHQCRAASQST